MLTESKHKMLASLMPLSYRSKFTLDRCRTRPVPSNVYIKRVVAAAAVAVARIFFTDAKTMETCNSWTWVEGKSDMATKFFGISGSLLAKF